VDSDGINMSRLREFFTVRNRTLTTDFHEDFTADSTLHSKNPEITIEGEPGNSPGKNTARKTWKMTKNINEAVAKFKGHRKTQSIVYKKQQEEEKHLPVVRQSLRTTKVLSKPKNDFLLDIEHYKAKCAEYEHIIKELKSENHKLTQEISDLIVARKEKENRRKSAIVNFESIKPNLESLNAVEEIKALKQEIDSEKGKNIKYIHLFEHERQKNAILNEQLESLMELAKVNEIDKNNPDTADEKTRTIQELEKKNEVLFKKLMSVSDLLYEKTLEYFFI
jgi:hypothetical protein